MANKINRRHFIELLGGAAAVTATGSLIGCKKSGDGHLAAYDDVPVGKMTYRTNPTTHDRVSILGYGMMRLPVKNADGTPTTSRDNPNASIDQEQVNRLVKYALDHGVNYFDTSPAYCQGQSEQSLGMALKAAGAKRDKFFVATKMSNFSPETQTRQASIEMFQNSLKALQVDHIDYYLLHGIGMGDGMETFNQRFIDNGILDYLLEQREKGVIRNLGFSYHGDVEVFNYLLANNDKYHWNFAQIELNYLDWYYAHGVVIRGKQNTDASYLYAELAKRGIPAVIMEPLLGGRLANVSNKIAAMMKQRDPDHSIASWAFRYAGSPKDVLTVLSGMTYMENLRENIVTFSPLKPVTEDEKKFLYRVAKEIYELQTIPCNECNYCMPCPYGLNIPGIFSYYNKCIKEGNITKDHRDPHYSEARRAFLVGYDRTIPKLRQADHCIGCGQCLEHCPQRIPIPANMTMISNYTEQLKQQVALRQDKSMG